MNKRHERVLNPCACGCGARIPGRFKQGHGVRYWNICRQVMKGTMHFTEMPAAMQIALKDYQGVRAALFDLRERTERRKL